MKQEHKNLKYLDYGISCVYEDCYSEYQSILIKNGVLTSTVVGMDKQPNYEEFLSLIKVGKEVVLKPEPDNPKDKDAIAVYLKTYRIGYIPRKKLPVVAACVDESGTKAIIDKVTENFVGISVKPTFTHLLDLNICKGVSFIEEKGNEYLYLTPETFMSKYYYDEDEALNIIRSDETDEIFIQAKMFEHKGHLFNLSKNALLFLRKNGSGINVLRGALHIGDVEDLYINKLDDQMSGSNCVSCYVESICASILTLRVPFGAKSQIMYIESVLNSIPPKINYGDCPNIIIGMGIPLSEKKYVQEIKDAQRCKKFSPNKICHYMFSPSTEENTVSLSRMFGSDAIYFDYDNDIIAEYMTETGRGVVATLESVNRKKNYGQEILVVELKCTLYKEYDTDAAGKIIHSKEFRKRINGDTNDCVLTLTNKYGGKVKANVDTLNNTYIKEDDEYEYVTLYSCVQEEIVGDEPYSLIYSDDTVFLGYKCFFEDDDEDEIEEYVVLESPNGYHQYNIFKTGCMDEEDESIDKMIHCSGRVCAKIIDCMPWDYEVGWLKVVFRIGIPK